MVNVALVHDQTLHSSQSTAGISIWMRTMILTRDDLRTHTPLHHMDSLLEYAVLQYPMLRPEYIKEKEGKTHCHRKMFEAVVAAQ